MRFCPQLSEPTPCECSIARLEGAFDLLAPDLDQSEIRPVLVSIQTFCDLGEGLIAANGLQIRVTNSNKAPIRRIVSSSL